MAVTSSWRSVTLCMFNPSGGLACLCTMKKSLGVAGSYITMQCNLMLVAKTSRDFNQ